MKRLALIAALPLLLAAPLAAQDEAEPVTPVSVVAASAPEEWVAVEPDDLLVMELAANADGTLRHVVIQLMPAPFSQPWVENIRTLARQHWWDGTSVYRMVGNWVTQWGDVSEEKALPDGVTSPLAEYTIDYPTDSLEGERTLRRPLRSDPYAERVTFSAGFPIAHRIYPPPQGEHSGLLSNVWPIHCYASVGVARDLAPDTGTGAELYAVIGHAPRQLDRNIAVVGRVIEGIEHLSTLKRGTGDAGVYESRAEDTPILSVRLGSELDEAPAFEYLATQSESFSRYVAVRANRQDAFYTVPAGGVDVCNVQVPIRRVES